MKKKSRKAKEPKTIERELYLEVEDSPEGLKIINAFIKLLVESRHDKAYLNGWIGPISK